MPRPRTETKRARLESYLAAHRPEIITVAVWHEIRRELAPVSESYLRELLLRCGVPLAPEIEGVRQDSLEEAERTLTALARAYEKAGPDERRQIRASVIDSKDRVRWALKRSSDEDVKALKSEILLWTLTWLENPAVFESWLTLRRRV